MIPQSQKDRGHDCASCYFSDCDDGNEQLFCHYEPPKAILAPQQSRLGSMQAVVIGQHPPVRANGWCGKWIFHENTPLGW